MTKSLRIMAPMMTMGTLPAAVSLWERALKVGLQRLATTAGMYSALRRREFPIFESRLLPRIEVPD